MWGLYLKKKVYKILNFYIVNCNMKLHKSYFLKLLIKSNLIDLFSWLGWLIICE